MGQAPGAGKAGVNGQRQFICVCRQSCSRDRAQTHRDLSRSANKTTGLILIGLGVFFLLANFNLIPDVGHLIAKWWPLILIAIGVQRWQSGAK